MTTKQLSIHAAAIRQDRLGSLSVLRPSVPDALVMGFGNMVHKQLGISCFQMGVSTM